MEAALVFAPSEELGAFFRVATFFLAGLFLADDLSKFILNWEAGVRTSVLFGGQRENDSKYAVPLSF